MVNIKRRTRLTVSTAFLSMATRIDTREKNMEFKKNCKLEELS